MLLFSSFTFILPFFFFWGGGCSGMVPAQLLLWPSCTTIRNLWSSAALCQPNNPCFASSFGLNTAALCEVGSSVILAPGGAITLNYQGTTSGESWTRDQTADHFFFKVVRTEDNGGHHISSTLNDLRKSPFKSRKAKCGCLLSRKGKRQQCDWQCGKEASCKKVETCLLGAYS